MATDNSSYATQLQDSLGFQAVESGFRTLSVEFRFRIPIVSLIPDSLSYIPDFNAHDSGFHMQKFLGFQNLDSRIWIPLFRARQLTVDKTDTIYIT